MPRPILEMVRDGTHSSPLPNCGDFSRELEVSRRTIMRDLDFLRDDENAPLAYDDSRKGFKLSDPTFVLPPVHLTRRDGSLEMRLNTSGRKELTRWILSWMPHVRVMAPGELRERMRERLSHRGWRAADEPARKTRDGVPRAQASIGHLVREKGQTRGWLPRPLIQQVDGGRG